jgi:hypothetical protein
MVAVALKTPTIMGRPRPFGEYGPSNITPRGTSRATTTPAVDVGLNADVEVLLRAGDDGDLLNGVGQD